jgi:hypothetical protein
MASSRVLPVNDTISTFGSAGFGRTYTVMSTWEAATDNDLVTATQSQSLVCYADAASFNLVVTLAGATANASYRRQIRGAAGQGYDGIPGNGFTLSSTANSNIVTLNELYAEVHNISLSGNYNSNINVRYLISLQNDFNKAVGCLGYNSLNSGTNIQNGFDIVDPNSSIINCLLKNIEGYGIGAGIASDLIYNNTVVGCGGVGIVVSAAATAINNLSDSNTGAEFSGTFGASSKNNASSDGSAPGTNSRTSQTFTYVNAAGNDYHLASGDAGARGFGFDMSATYDDDVDMQVVTTWSIGFDSISATGTTYSFIANVLGLSSTLNIASRYNRNLAGSLLGISTTPNAAYRAIREVLANAAGLSSTANADAYTARNIESSVNGTTLTADLDMHTLRGVAASVVAQSITPSVDTYLLRSLLTNILAESLTSNISLEVTGAIDLMASILALSATPIADAYILRSLRSDMNGTSATTELGTHMTRRLIANLISISETPVSDAYLMRTLVANISSLSDTLDIAANLLNLLDLLAIIEGQSAAQDIDARHLRSLMVVVNASLSTEDISVYMARNLLADVYGLSLSSDDVSMILEGLGIIIDPGVEPLMHLKKVTSFSRAKNILSMREFLHG